MDDEELASQLLNEFEKSDEIEYLPPNDDEKNDDAQKNCDPIGLLMLIFTWIEGLRKGSRLVWVPSEECLFYANAAADKVNEIACTCFVKGCRERIFIKDDGSGKRKKPPNHNHGSLYNVYKERFLFTFMKERVRTAPASAENRDVFDEAVLM